MSISKLTGTLVYVQIDQPKPCYVEEKGHEWKASIVVDEETADTWDEAFPKQTAKQVKTSDFEGIYKIPAPFESQRKQYIITLRKNTKLGNGNDVPLQYQPKVFQKKGNTLVDITKSILVANGSVGQMSVEVYDGKMGSFARLKNVMVTELIEYTKKDSAGEDAGSEFGLEIAPEESQPTVKVEAKPAAKPKAKPVQEQDDSETETDSPF